MVFDTNIFISAFAIPGGKAEEAYLLAINGAFTLCSSVFILTETAGKLRQKFGWADDRIRKFLKSVAKFVTIIKTQPTLHVLSDEPDNRILECALAAQAAAIVTGDKHLLALKEFRGVEIVKLSDFLKSLSP